MEKHHGQIVEYLVRKNGYSITDLAMELRVNRRSIYNYFQNCYLKRDVILKIGWVIRHDFSKEFPEIFNSEDFSYSHKQAKFTVFPPNTNNNNNNVSEDIWKDKYLELLESYNNALLGRLNILSGDQESIAKTVAN